MLGGLGGTEMGSGDGWRREEVSRCICSILWRWRAVPVWRLPDWRRLEGRLGSARSDGLGSVSVVAGVYIVATRDQEGSRFVSA